MEHRTMDSAIKIVQLYDLPGLDTICGRGEHATDNSPDQAAASGSRHATFSGIRPQTRARTKIVAQN